MAGLLKSGRPDTVWFCKYLVISVMWNGSVAGLQKRGRPDTAKFCKWLGVRCM